VGFLDTAILNHWVPKKYSTSLDERLRTEHVHGFEQEKGTEKLKTTRLKK